MEAVLKRLVIGLLCFSPCLSIAQGIAEEGRKTTLEEIIVTATKRGPTLLKDTAISIRAIGADVLSAKDVQDFTDWAPLVPGLIAEDQGPGEKRYIIRGVRAVGPSTVGVYLDDAVISGFNTEDDGGGRNADIRLYDVERIEVLRGPQGTLYGAGSLSGTIRYITNKPDPESIYGQVGGTVSSTDSGGTNFKTNGHINIPISDSFAVRAVGWYEDEDGFIDNVRLGIDDVNDEETKGGRLAARWLVNDDLEFNASAVIQRTELGGKQRYYPFIGDLDTDEFVVDTYEDDTDVYQASMTYEFSAGTVHASTAWFDREVFYRFDSTPILLFFGVPLPFAIAVTDQPEERQLWSNEIRFASNFDGPFQMLVGAFYSELDREFASNVISATEDGVPTGTEPDIFGRVSDFQIDEVALFGEFSYEFSERWTGIFGLRWFDFEQDSQSRETLPFGGFDPGDEPPPDPDRSASESDVSLKFSLSYKLNEDVTLYALYSEGFRQGGTNSTGFGNLIVIPEGFESDAVENIEVGAKTLWWDDRVAINATVYTIDWSDIQTLEQEPVQGFPFIGNAGTAQVDGIEFELFAQPDDRWDIAVSATYLDARLTEDQPALQVETPVGKDGDSIPYVPDFTAAISVQYDFPIVGAWNGFARADWNYVGSSDTQFNRDGEFFEKQDAYDVLDLRVAARNEAWEVALFVDNVFDERAEITIFESIAVPQSVFTNRPLTFGATVNFSF
jgi:outer membrane receptor protein involved in Fe transport